MDRERLSEDSDKVDRRTTEWRNGLFNLSFDDDCGYLALLFPSVVDPGPTNSAAGDGVGSTAADGGGAGRDHGGPAVNERSWLGASAPAATYGGRSSPQPGDVSPGGSAGAPAEPTRDTRPLILDDGDGDGDQESALRIVGEVWLPFLLAGLGCVLAGLVLDLVQVSCVCSYLIQVRASRGVHHRRRRRGQRGGHVHP